MHKLSQLYTMVCDAPAGAEFRIDRLPQWLERDPQDNRQPHVHTFYEIIWFQEGGGSHTVDFRSYPILPNSFFLLCPGQVHHFDGEARNRGLMLRFCTDFLKDDLRADDAFLRYNVFNNFDPSPYCLVADGQRLAEMATLADSMERELLNHNDPDHLDMVRCLARMFLIYLHRHGRREGSARLDEMRPAHRLFLRFRQMVELNYATIHGVQDYAQRLGTSPKTLSQAVRECAGTTPLDFINRRVVLEAKRLLLFTPLMAKEVAYQLGYDDPSYFAKIFKRATGLLPTEMRGRDNKL